MHVVGDVVRKHMQAVCIVGKQEQLPRQEHGYVAVCTLGGSFGRLMPAT